MNNEMMFFLLYGLLCGVAGMFWGRVQTLIKAYFDMKRRKIEYASLEEAKTELICKGPHSYDRIKLAMAELPVDEYLVCKDCGFVSNSEGSYKLNGPALEIYHAELNRRTKAIEIDAELRRRKQERIDQLMNVLVRANIEKFDGDLSKNSYELQQFYRKTALELESVYAGLKKDLDDLERG